MVFSIDKSSTFESMEAFFEKARDTCQSPPIVILVGNKADFDKNGMRVVEKHEAKEL